MEAHGAQTNDQMLANYYMQYAAGNEYLGSQVRDSDEDYVPTPMYREEKKTIDKTVNGDVINHKPEPKKKNYKDVYYCDLCDWSGSHTSYYNHKKYVHQGISYSCDQCEYSGMIYLIINYDFFIRINLVINFYGSIVYEISLQLL